jgi:hypothetical protein
MFATVFYIIPFFIGSKIGFLAVDSVVFFNWLFSLRFAATRRWRFLARKFNRRTVLEPTTKLSYEALHQPLRQTAVSSRFSSFSGVKYS